MKYYLKTISIIQYILLSISIIILLTVPTLLSYFPELFSEKNISLLYNISHITLFFTMMVRPLADIIGGRNYIRPLIILRKGAGVLSASIIVSLILSKIIIEPNTFITDIFQTSYWSMYNYAIFAHLADLTAIILLVTSNNFSKRILGTYWKKIQKLSYVYFYASALYVFLSYSDLKLLFAMVIVTILTYWAFIKNNKEKIYAN